MRRWLVCAICLGGLAIAGEPSPAAWPFGPGEHLTFRLRWQFLTGGEATMRVMADSADPSRWRLHTVARSTGVVDLFYTVRDTLHSTIDRTTLCPARFEKRQHEGGFHRDSTYIFDQERRLIFREGLAEALACSSRVYDILSVLYRVRAHPLQVGQTLHAVVYEGGRCYPVGVRVVRRETITVPAGTFSCVVIEPIPPSKNDAARKGRLWVWMSDDARRIPVRLQIAISIGKISAELVSYRPPDGAVASSSSP